jgi:hypothetical protein
VIIAGGALTHWHSLPVTGWVPPAAEHLMIGLIMIGSSAAAAGGS